MQTRSVYKPGPYCPHCAASMQMLGSLPRFAGSGELQTFECRLCGLMLTEAIDDQALDAAIPLAPR
jgi:transposase-like protein